MKAVPERDPGAARAQPVPARTGVSRTTAPPPQRPPGDRPAPGPDPRSLQRLQRAAGNAAVSRLVAQRYTAPVKPSPAQTPGFRRVQSDVAAKKTRLVTHAPAAAESKSAQDAAVAPPDDKEAQGKAANAEKMHAAKPGEFNKQAFVDAVNKAIDAQAPKNLDEADKFSKSGKADRIKSEVDGKVSDGKESSAKDIETATEAPPDTAAAKDKPVTPMTPDQPPANPGAPSAADATPDRQPAAVTDFSQGPAANDKALADADVTEEQLAKGNEPAFDGALSAKKTAEADSAKAPARARGAENQQLSTAKAGAAAAGTQAMTALTATRSAAGKQVDSGKGETKTRDEKRRAEVTAKLQKVYDTTKKDVEETLSGLDKKVDTAFTAGEKAARDAFTADHKRRMKAYKDKRYSGLTGKARWVKDKFAGLPKEANNLYQEARKLYVTKMQAVISSVADLIGTELGRAKARIAKGRTELKAEVDRLPADLRQFGQDAAKDFAGKFDDLESTVDEKSQQLVQDLANKYTAALNKIDEEIKKLQEANKGLIDKAKDAIVGVLKTINELKNLLLGILAKAASAIMKIIKDPIGFLNNLVHAVGAGLQLFITNVADHLKTGVVSWLLGTAVKAGLELPQRFDLKGIIQLIGSLLGLTWANIRARITRKGVPDQALTVVETSLPVAKKLAAEGPAGAVKEIQAEAGDLKATILQKLTSYLIPTVIIAGITWIVSLLNPASAFVRAVKGIIDIVTFIVNQGAQIVEFVNAVLDAVVAIANGGQAGVPQMIEAALAASVPLLIGFLASLLGIGGLANKVKSVFHTVSRPVNRAIDKIVDFIAKKCKALLEKLKPKPKKEVNGKGNLPIRSAGQSSKKKKSELPEAMREAHSITQDHERRGSSDRSLMKALKELKKRFTWIRGFEIEEQKPRSVWLLASKNKVFDDWPRSVHGSRGGSTDDELVEAARKRFFGSRTSVSCYYCRRLDAEAVEHIRPRNRGGDNEESNLVPVCVHCNSSKGDRVAPKTPPRGYEGKWPAPWWPTQMQVWYVTHYGTPPRYWTLDEDEKPDERFHDGTSPRIPPGSHGGSTDESVLREAKKRIFAGRREVACLYCAKPRATAVEHIWPRKYGGDNEESNLGPSCARCNSSKGDRPAPETPPHDYVGKWPPPWWPTRMQVWWVQTYGPPKEF
ncbi:HNH endonuclease [Streptomyces sp. NPDC014622]|uniref:HNH endonuclease n=1 Tax=Streptomyces sp. NPDC014622 TaxID=3364874 RepID=UPI0036F5C16A